MDVAVNDRMTVTVKTMKRTDYRSVVKNQFFEGKKIGER
jgi:hypothetical protein